MRFHTYDEESGVERLGGNCIGVGQEVHRQTRTRKTEVGRE